MSYTSTSTPPLCVHYHYVPLMPRLLDLYDDVVPVILDIVFFFLMIRRPPRSTQGVSSAASDVYKRQYQRRVHGNSVSWHSSASSEWVTDFIYPAEDIFCRVNQYAHLMAEALQNLTTQSSI
eukprot:TRINITY_DN68701_c0_g1_i1.p1 TRINITY_DN68701_c0_g1~~TRINITY_DN68701_c0_g1_i1.p1  ORF type:complete len:122 (+),score=22.22 TRINITY_DN68701_c0_g1_i1:1-366(+)